MNPFPTNTFPSFDNINDPSLSLILGRQEPHYDDVPISLNDILSDDSLLDFGDFDVDTLAFPPPQILSQGGLPRDMKPFPQTTGANAPPPPQTSILPPVALQPTFNAPSGPYTLLSQPSGSHLASSSSAAFDDGGQQQASLFGIQNIPVPTPSAPAPAVAPASAPAPSSSSSVNRMNPAFGWSTGAHTPVVRTWDSMTPSMGRAATAAAAPTPGASANAEPRQVPVPPWSSRRRYPLVRVDDTIEWVRPDVMKMVIYYNFSPNAEDEAHESWDPRV